MESYEIVAAARADWPAVRDLLQAAGLQPAGLEPFITTTLLAMEAGTPVGCVALEPYGRHALLRSLAVRADRRGAGIGVALAAAAVESARRMAVTHVYLLTETAADFFPRFGFERTTRDAVPEAVRRSVEFTTLCPESATVMALELRQPT